MLFSVSQQWWLTNNMRKCSIFSGLLTFGLLLSVAGVVQADALYQVSVNTASLAGTTGSIDFQFNFGNGEKQAASVAITGLTGGTNGTATSTGQASGAFPGTVTIANGYPTSGYNDFFETYTYGSTLKFALDFSGPAVTAPNGTSTGNSEFYFSLISDVNGITPAPGTNSNGVAGTVAINPNGSATATAVSSNLSFAPEPSSLWLTLGAGLTLAGAAFLRRRSIQ